MSDCGCSEAAERLQGRVLVVLLAINAVMFVVEAVVGWLAESTGLLGDSLANCGVILSGGLVYLTDSPIPDLVAGAAIAGLVTWGGIRILRDDGD